MIEMIELADRDIKRAIINMLNKLKDLKKNMSIMKREIEDIKRNQNVTG